MTCSLAKIILVITLIVSIAVYHFGFHQRTEVKSLAIKVFFDQAQTQELKQGATLNWGKISPGVWKLTLYVNNTGSANVILRFNYRENQLPKGLTEYWDYDGTPLAHNELRKVTITLVIPEHVDAGVYEFESSITATPAYYDTIAHPKN